MLNRFANCTRVTREKVDENDRRTFWIVLRTVKELRSMSLGTWWQKLLGGFWPVCITHFLKACTYKSLGRSWKKNGLRSKLEQTWALLEKKKRCYIVESAPCLAAGVKVLRTAFIRADMGLSWVHCPESCARSRRRRLNDMQGLLVGAVTTGLGDVVLLDSCSHRNCGVFIMYDVTNWDAWTWWCSLCIVRC